MKESIHTQLEAGTGVNNDLDTEDEHLILADYDSDDAKMADDSDDENNENEDVYCTKVFLSL